MATMITTAHGQRSGLDQNQVDLTWERLQEQAMHAFRAGDTAIATANWAKALEIAERYFDRGDPRLAASRSNQAFSLMRQKQIHQANTLFQQAIAAWEASWRWVPLMVAPRLPDDIESLPYGKAVQDEFYGFIKQGKHMTEALQQEQRLPVGGLEEWQEVKPHSMTDVRKLFAAVFLMASAKPAG